MVNVNVMSSSPEAIGDDVVSQPLPEPMKPRSAPSLQYSGKLQPGADGNWHADH